MLRLYINVLLVFSSSLMFEWGRTPALLAFLLGWVWHNYMKSHETDTANTRLIQARLELINWVSKQGHDRCWYYPEIFQSLAASLGVPLIVRNPSLPSRKEFEAGCKRYQDEEYGG